jgi:hypothetical protein
MVGSSNVTEICGRSNPGWRVAWKSMWHTSNTTLLLEALYNELVSDAALSRPQQQQQETVVLPPIVALMSPIVRVLPNPIRDWAMDLFGASSGMDTFVGRASNHTTGRE